MMAEDDFDELEGEELGEYVPALFARTPTEAEKYLQLLEDYGIPARVDEEFLPPKSLRKVAAEGVAVLVPESLLEDAKGFLEDLSDEELNATDEEDDDLEEDEEEEDVDEEEDEEDEKAPFVVATDEEEEDEEDEEDEDELGLFSDEDELEEDEDDEEEDEEDEEDEEEGDEEEDEEEEDADGLDGPETDGEPGKG
jgi:hypothetical protein